MIKEFTLTRGGWFAVASSSLDGRSLTLKRRKCSRVAPGNTCSEQRVYPDTGGWFAVVLFPWGSRRFIFRIVSCLIFPSWGFHQVQFSSFSVVFISLGLQEVHFATCDLFFHLPGAPGGTLLQLLGACSSPLGLQEVHVSNCFLLVFPSWGFQEVPFFKCFLMVSSPWGSRRFIFRT